VRVLKRLPSVAGFLAVLAGLPPPVVPAEVFDLDISPDPALIVNTTYDASLREVYAATAGGLYRFRRDGDRKAEVVFKRETGTLLVLAPGGVLFGLLSPRGEAPGPFSARIRRIQPASTIDLPVQGGVSDLILGAGGKLMITVTRLEPLESSAKRLRYTFFDPDGKPLSREDIEEPRNWFIDPEGSAVLFAGPGEASVYTRDGKQKGKWTAGGVYHPAAIGPGGDTAVLIRTDGEARELVLRRPSSSANLPMETPVAHLRLAADASFALVVFADSSYAILDIGGAALSQARRLPLENVYRITDAEIIDAGTLAFGVLHGTPDSLEENGSVVAIERVEGKKVLFQEKLPLRSPTAALPAVDTAPGSAAFIARTDLRSIFIDLGN
jgi:hypothetical protein